MALARGAAPWLLASAGASAALVVLGYYLRVPPVLWLALVPGFFFAFLLQFFRDPERQAAPGISSPADGKVSCIDVVNDADIGAADRICIFMSPIDVHVNRFPLDGTVRTVTHVPGGFVPAFRKESDRNERVETILDTPHGPIKVIQIAGTVARRIVPYVKAGDTATKGQRMGLIRLGSRCDVLAPVGVLQWLPTLGQQVYAGTTPLAQVRP